ncbi:C40 family peptidase [Paludibaculum fermentans]|uniref:C40 family peptidase n=1 Tax=Paludibaculum fermentans TaxID=1473598 RepID=UPI003EC00628
MTTINTTIPGRAAVREAGQAVDPRARVVQCAKKWVNQPFRYGVKAQCCEFVRHVFGQAGIKLPVVKFPSDYALLVHDGLSTGAGYADSLAGDEVGPKVKLSEAQAGDIILYKDTYNDGWSQGIITHVGIYMGDEKMIDRPTMDGTVLHRSVYTSTGSIAELRRPRQFADPTTYIKLEAGVVKAAIKGKAVYSLEMGLSYLGVVTAMVNGAPRAPKSVTIQVVDSQTKQHHYFLYAEGKAKAVVNGLPVRTLTCRAKLEGGAIHLWMNGKEIRSKRLVFEIESA